MRWLALPGLLACAACSAPSGQLADDAGTIGSTWVALDLTTGRVAPVAAPDPADPAWRTTRMLFRQVPANAMTVGRPVGDDLTEEDERPERATSTGLVWIGAFEVTQAQWAALAGTWPWYDALPFADLDPYVGPDRPAFALSATAVLAACRGRATGGWNLDLPDGDEWELACLAGGSAKFAWGDAYDDAATAAAWAVVDADGSGSARPQPVGSRRANAWGLFDLHGNAWELVRTDAGFAVCGGGWDQPTLAARASNRIALTATAAGWCVGARLVLRR